MCQAQMSTVRRGTTRPMAPLGTTQAVDMTAMTTGQAMAPPLATMMPLATLATPQVHHVVMFVAVHFPLLPCNGPFTANLRA